ncbi:DUF116 domain-containing protein [Desulfurispirillum indicum]|uniref:DUF116 domain-containing protein n=1 Tax=Desulfurispirillum indicum (strain ATCC BAA-1389 / DSM 22839 / S5) TaxID=653733 RepID=E6W0N2_DESIS|nr:DUF116 domain-containing protein [Desulfurispirillum indicum]ADU65284.1 protein of unknown function DUF116 [Desulfurispirillum indicum S5]UCZ57182.1 DUF116 domain-containing protein [Desulfurispirillum indicum]
MSSQKPYFKILFFLLTALLLLFSFATGYAAMRFAPVSMKAAAVWAMPSLLAAAMAALPIVFYLCLKSGFRTFLFQIANRYCIRVFFPLILFFGERLRIERDLLIQELVQYNNKYVLRKHAGSFEPQRMLVLLPHCLQMRDCDYRVTTDISRCALCGRCSIHKFVELSRKYGVHVQAATGGTLARRIIQELRPRVIIAVACSRDLYSGLSDTFPLPVVGIFNELRHGPCVDTSVDAAKVEETIRELIKPEYVTKSFVQDL